MRIAVIPSWFPSPDAPTLGIFFADFVEALAGEHEVVILLPDLVRFTSIGYERLAFGKRGRAEIIRSFSRPALPRCGLGNRLGLIRAARRAMRACVEKFGAPDVILAMHADPAGWLGLRLAQAQKRPLVLSECASFTEDFERLPHYARIRQAFLRADAVVVPSRFLAEKLRNQGLCREASALPNLVDTEYFTPASGISQKSIPTVLSVGNLVPVKGMADLIDAAAILQKRMSKPFRLRIVGDGPQRQELEQRAQRLGLGEICAFMGRLSREDMKAEMQKCDVFVTASLTETFGIALCEAMSCGKPCVATRSGGPEDFVTVECGILVDPSSPEQMADALFRILAGQVKFDAYVIRRKMEDFGPASYVKRYTELFEKLLRSRTIFAKQSQRCA